MSDTASPTLSIIIPTYQAAATLAEALESVAGQTFRSFEVLIMDGGSRDATRAIAEKYNGRFPAFRFFSEPDKGIYDAMNKGIDQAKGQWLYFLGSDDTLFSNDVLEKIFVPANTKDTDVLYGQVWLTHRHQLHLGKFDAEKMVFRNISHQALFIRKTVFDTLGKFDLKYAICADHIFNVRWFFDPAFRNRYVDVVVAKFGQDGISSQKDDEEKVRDLPGLVKQYGGSFLYFRLYTLRPIRMWGRKKLALCKKLLLRFVPIIT
jgi:glycosyltransferase involved in cell wall biosynthesis